MILDHLIAMNLFSMKKNQSVLSNYPSDSKQAICASIIEAISTHPSETLSSWPQIQFGMEAIGTSFTLPLSASANNSHIIKSGIKIYATWLRNTPSSAKPHEDSFICTIMEHCSLLFSDLDLTTDRIRSEERLKLALMGHKMFENLITYRWKDMSMLATENLLRVFLGVTDKLLHEREGENLISTQIATQTSRLVVEVYLRSSVSLTSSHRRLLELWDLLGTFAIRWCHRHVFVAQWSELVVQVTHSLVMFVCGNREGAILMGGGGENDKSAGDSTNEKGGRIKASGGDKLNNDDRDDGDGEDAENVDDDDDDDDDEDDEGYNNISAKFRKRSIDLFISWSSAHTAVGSTTGSQLRISNFSPFALKIVWSRLVNLLGNPNRMVFHEDGSHVSPQVMDCAMNSVDRMVNEMLLVGSNDDASALSMNLTKSGRYEVSTGDNKCRRTSPISFRGGIIANFRRRPPHSLPSSPRRFLPLHFLPSRIPS